MTQKVTVKTGPGEQSSESFLKSKADLIKIHGLENIKVVPCYDELIASFDTSGSLYMIIYRENTEDHIDQMPAQGC